MLTIYLSAIESPEEKIRFETLYDTYRGFMLKIAAQVLHGGQDAEDAVHSAFLSIAKNMDVVPPLDSPKMQGFLYIVTRNKAIDILREQGRREDEGPLEEQLVYTSPDDGGHLAWCISQLPPRYQDIILLKYSHGYSTREIAGLFGISFTTASKLDQRAKNRLRELCEKEGIL